MKKQVLLIAADLDPKDLGGAEVHVVEVVRRLAERINFTVLVGKSREISNVWPKNVDVRTVSYPQIVNFKNFAYIIYSVLAGGKILLNKRYDWLWAKQEFPQGVTAVILGKIFSVPVYVTAQNPRAYCEEMVLEGRIKRVSSLIIKFLERLVKMVMSHATIVAAVSSYSVKIAKQFGAKRTVIIPNGVDTSFFKIKQKGRFSSRITIVSHSTLIPRNAIDIVIKALSLLPRSISWKFLLAGDGPERKNLQSLVRNLHLVKQIRFLGTLDKPAVVRVLAQGDIYVRPSRFEGFGVSFLEAMAMNLPVITTHCGGQKDFIIPDKTGVVVPVDDPKDVAWAIEKLAGNPNLQKKIVFNGRELVAKKYNWEVISQKVYGIIS